MALENEILNGLSEIESLEPRRTPAFVNSVYDPVALTLTVNFNGADDDIHLWQGQNGVYLSWTSGGGAPPVLLDDVAPGLQGIIINAGGGDDSITFENIDFAASPDSAADTVIIHGGGGDDYIALSDSNGPGTNTVSVTGGNGSDTLHIFNANAASDSLDGGAGFDMASWAGAAVGVNVGINGTFTNTVGGYATLSNFEGVIGTAYDDMLTGDAADNEIIGGDGNDTLLGGNGEDTLVSDVRQDKVNGNAGRNTLLRETMMAVTRAKARRIRFVVNEF